MVSTSLKAALAGALAVTGLGGGYCLVQAAASDAPAVISTLPRAGTTDVDPAAKEITVTFDRDMGKGFSWTGGGSDYPPIAEGQRPFWRDARTAVLPVSLATGRYYRVGINSKSHRNFKSAEGVSARPSVIFFTTCGAGPELTAKVQAATGASSAPASCPFKMNFSPDNIEMPVKKFPDVSGTVIDGALDASRPKLEAVIQCLKAQQKAAEAGDMARYEAVGRESASNLVNVVRPTRPIPRAVVTLYRHADGAAGKPVQSVTADEQGKFEFFGVPQDIYRIVARDVRNGTNGCPAAELTVEHYRTCEHVRLVVHPQTVTLKGRVSDSAGKPLANVAVSAKQDHGLFGETEGDFTRAYHETAAQTDADGRYELRGLVPAGWWEAGGLESGGYGGADIWYKVTVSVPGYVDTTAAVPVVPEEAREAARLAVSLMAAAATPHQLAERRKGAPTAQPPCRGFALSGVDFVLFKPASVSGVAVDGNGCPRGGCQIALSFTNRTDRLSYAQRHEAPLWVRCDEKGAFRVTGISPGTYWARVYEHDRCVTGKASPVVTVREGEALAGLRLVDDAPPCGKIVGVVTDAASGKPVKGLTVYATHKETGSTDCPPLLCQCGMRGYHTEACKRWVEHAIQTNDLRVSTFVVEKASPGPTELVLKAPDYAEERVTVDVASEAVMKREIKLWRAGVALIRPVLEKGASVDYYASIRYADVPEHPPLVHYVAFPEGGGTPVSGGRLSTSFGCDAFEGLKPGRHTLRGDVCYLSGRVTRYETAPLETASGQTNEVALAFGGPCQLKLRADFPPGTAVSVLLETADTPVGQTPESNPGLKASAYLRKPGSLLIPDLKPGAYRLSLFRRDVPTKKGGKEKREPDEVKMVTLTPENASQSVSCRFLETGP